MSEIALEKTLKLWQSEPFSWDGKDCLMSIADYVLLSTGVDYGARWRHQYYDKNGAKRLVERDGGAVAMIDSVGLERRSGACQRGDIVVISFKDIAGIFTGETVAFRSETGLMQINFLFVDIKAAWIVK